MHIRRVIVLLLYSITVLLSAVEVYSDKRIPEKFKSMVRYGRSSRKSSRSSSNERESKPLDVRRADSFLVGTRFGKRSSWNPNASLVYSVSESPCGEPEQLSCTWVGLSNLYKCIASPKHTRSTVRFPTDIKRHDEQLEVVQEGKSLGERPVDDFGLKMQSRFNADM